eukprot:TRINITY_DN67202_c3_g1_i2.p1 TRINITY_DN67202_c3_g1~~TRINITY_DN67202_c3_g1_i2.p1  ORF type:complete len:321 (+),score=7.60 TRINITY_DN67202_c3_g1_i2:51-1013(+)
MPPAHCFLDFPDDVIQIVADFCSESTLSTTCSALWELLCFRFIPQVRSHADWLKLQNQCSDFKQENVRSLTLHRLATEDLLCISTSVWELYNLQSLTLTVLEDDGGAVCQLLSHLPLLAQLTVTSPTHFACLQQALTDKLYLASLTVMGGSSSNEFVSTAASGKRPAGGCLPELSTFRLEPYFNSTAASMATLLQFVALNTTNLRNLSLSCSYCQVNPNMMSSLADLLERSQNLRKCHLDLAGTPLDVEGITVLVSSLAASKAHKTLHMQDTPVYRVLTKSKQDLLYHNLLVQLREECGAVRLASKMTPPDTESETSESD